MEFAYYWIALWILFIVIEIFVFSLDFLALWIAAILTWIIVMIFWIWFDNWWISWFIFFINWIINLLLFKKFLVPYLNSTVKEWSPLSADNVSWKKLIIQIVNWEKVVFDEWSYWIVYSDDEVNQWDNVEVISMKSWWYKVKKIF